ncbi:MAG: TIGR04255 family protein [Ferruginibacter sp.]
MSERSYQILSNAPLKEVIFELHWDLEYIPEEAIQIDKGFEEAAMNFRSSCQQGFKFVEILKPASIPHTAFNNRVTHRFFKEKGKHPLYQFGPGVFTINDNNKNYRWNEFYNMVINGVNCLKNSYSTTLVLNKVELRYVDAVQANILGEMDKFDFLRNHLHVNAQGYDFVDGQLEDINFAKRFSIDDKYLNIMIATGVDRQTRETSVMWHTYINNRKRVEWENIPNWLEEAHRMASKTFRKMFSDELYNKFI